MGAWVASPLVGVFDEAPSLVSMLLDRNEEKAADEESWCESMLRIALEMW